MQEKEAMLIREKVALMEVVDEREKVARKVTFNPAIRAHGDSGG